MSATRREFLHISALAATAAALGPGALLSRAAPPEAKSSADGASTGKSDRPLKILILGGTGFLGPAIINAARPRGHTLTLFNRGKTNPHLFPELEKLRGDRKTKDLSSLAGRDWDVVCDDCGYIPRHIREMADVLKGHVNHYIFISSVSAVGEKLTPNSDETTPVTTMPDETVEDVRAHYGALKALCEKAAEEAFPGRTTNIRPGLIVGPEDPTDRFTYWPVRIDRGGEVLAPGEPADPVQVIDVRDLGEWIVRVMEQRTFGIYNALGPEQTLTIGRMLEACRKASSNEAKLTWVNADFLEQQKVEPWGDMPVWVPPRGASAGFGQISNRKAVRQGLKFRPIDQTAADTLAWFKAQPAERQKLRAGISSEREAEVLRAWHNRTASK